MVFLLGEEDECFLELCISITFTHLSCHDVFEVFIINGDNSLLVLIVVSVLGAVVQVADQPLDLLLGWLETKCSQSYLQVLH